MNIYYYLFSRISLAINKKHKNAWGAMHAFSLLIYINIIVIYIKLFNVTLIKFNNGYKSGLIVLGALLITCNYFIFLHNNKYKEIEKKYKDESKNKRIIGGFLVIIYILLTVSSIFII